jgi:diphosphomevalonate decarboxylase
MTIMASASSLDKVSLNFYFENEINVKFEKKISLFLESQIERFPWLKDYHLDISSHNTFPHSSGIASSASSMSALALCLMSLDEEITSHTFLKEDFFKEASDISRKASGSASRSIYSNLVSWGEIDTIPTSSNLFSTPIHSDEIHSDFKDYCDAILIVDSDEKIVSSSAGHSLMTNHPFAERRFKLARSNLTKLLHAIKVGDMNTFMEIVEEEALMLHALMMTSSPCFILLKPNSLLLIEKIKNFRAQSGVPVCFTIDAGPNIHLLYPLKYKEEVESKLVNNFIDLKIVQKVIYDTVGAGPCKL